MLLLGLALGLMNLYAGSVADLLDLGPSGSTWLRLISAIALARAAVDMMTRALNAFFAQKWSNIIALVQVILELSFVGIALALGYEMNGLLGGLLGAALAVALLSVGIVSWQFRHVELPVSRVIWIAALVIGVLVLVPFLPYGRVTAEGVHRMAMSDWYKHLMVTTVLEGGEFPPPNAFLADARAAPYYYGFHLVAAAIENVGRIGSTFWLLLAFTVLTAAAYPVVLFVVARDLFDDTRRAVTAAIGGSFLAGFDAAVWVAHAARDTLSAWPLPAGPAGLRAAVPMTSIDFWIHHNERQFTGPYVTAIWAPHHLAAVLLSLLVIREVCVARPGPRRQLLPVVLLASIPAMSVYVALALFVGVGVAIAVDAWMARRPPWAVHSGRRWAQVGVPAFALSLPVLWVLAGSRSPLEVGVSSAGTLLNGAIFTALLGDGVVARLLDTPALYLVEFGIVGVMGVTGLVGRASRGSLSSPQRTVAIIAAAVVVLVTLVRLPVDGPNNLYARPMLLVWSLLACFAADAWCAMIRVGPRHLATSPASHWGSSVRRSRCWVLLRRRSSGRHRPTRSRPFGGSTRAHHAGRSWPTIPTGVATATGCADRWSSTTGDLALLFGATGAEYDTVARRFHDAYDSDSPAEAADRFDRLGADVIVVDIPSPAWARPPCFLEGYGGPRVGVVTRNPGACVGRAE